MRGLKREAISFPSTDGKHTIAGVILRDLSVKPRGIIQICHGMAERMSRHEDFAAFLAGEGFIACGHDHLGHGDSIDDVSERGHVPAKGGMDIWIDDAHRLREMMQQRFGEELPYFLFGHSMGSFIVRAYMARYGAGLSGAILCGTNFLPAFLSKNGNRLCREIAHTHGETYHSKTLQNLATGGYNKKIENSENEYAWLSYNAENFREYVLDDTCGYMFTAGGYAALTALTHDIVLPKQAAKVPPELPMLFVSGEDDPVGDMGKGPRKAAEFYRNAGVRDVELKLYPHMRHEPLREADAATVKADILAWMQGHL